MSSLPSPLRAHSSIGREQLPREVREAHRRERVLDAATDVFAERGYHATTVEHILATARVSVGGFYELFDNKQDCFLAACDRAIAGASERLLTAIPPNADWPTRVRAALGHLIELIEDDPASARLLFREAQTAGPPGLERYRSCIEAAAAFLRPPVLDPRLPEDLEIALVSGVARVLGDRAIEAQGPDSLADLREELAAFLLGPYFAQAPTAPSLEGQVAAAG